MPNTSGRRHKQALNGFKHLAPRQRPNYKRRDTAAAAKHEAELRRREREREQRKGASKK